MEQRRRLILFCSSMFFALVFWRIVVFLNSGKISCLRRITGLNLHHYYYGIILVFITCLIFIFNKPGKYSLLLSGIGFGTFFDGFISRLLGNTSRMVEIINYNSAFGLTIFLFIILILSCLDIFLFFVKRRI